MEDTLLMDLFQAYFDARRNKRNTLNALAFEIDYESKLFQLYDDIRNRNYEIGPSICFIVFKPVQREVFAADFRDRIVHHLIYNYLNPIFERLFIHDCYSCRKGKGTSFGIQRIDHFIRSCSENYKKDAYILKLDIRGYFMSMDRRLLYEKIQNTIEHTRAKYELEFDLETLFYLLEKVVFHDPTQNCVIRGQRRDWVGLAKTKSLFTAGKGNGFPIGNLTSQLFGNIYLNDFDHFIKCKLKCRYYGRYVDDFVIVHRDQNALKGMLPVLNEHLRSRLGLELHPKKVYLQHYTKGVQFLGAVIKPYRIYIHRRMKGNFYEAIQRWNQRIGEWKEFQKEEGNQFLFTMNSYLGMMKACDTFRLRKKMIEEVMDEKCWRYFYVSEDYGKLNSGLTLNPSPKGEGLEFNCISSPPLGGFRGPRRGQFREPKHRQFQ
jgi:hypothetical protein